MNLLACQLVSSADIDDNFRRLERQLQQLHTASGDLAAMDRHQATLVVLPECFAIFGGSAGLNLKHQEILGEGGRMQARLSALAKKYRIWLAGGTIPTTSGLASKCFTTLPVFNPQGELVAHYQKIHLFDVDVADATGAYRESDSTAAGNRVVVFDMAGITVGLAVCYDVRFPGLFQQLAHRGAQVIVLPSAFTRRTGQAHWHALLRARAIENQIYIVAAGQGGIHANGRETYGHSLIVDPWGDIVAQAQKNEELIHGVYDQDLLNRVRKDMPLQQHNRFTSDLTTGLPAYKERAN